MGRKGCLFTCPIAFNCLFKTARLVLEEEPAVGKFIIQQFLTATSLKCSIEIFPLNPDGPLILIDQQRHARLDHLLYCLQGLTNVYEDGPKGFCADS